MKITLYMATSTDGYIATKDGDSDWVSEVDAKNFENKVKELGCIIVGNRTYKQYQGDLYPIEGVTNIVLSRNNQDSKAADNVIYVTSPKEAIDIAKSRNHYQALLIGGGTVNGLFLKENLIDEIYLSVHPLVFGDGIKLFENTEKSLKLNLIDQKELGESLVQLHYSVIK